MIIESIRIALTSLRTNKLRTFLSMLGIVIGVGAVIAIVSIGSGAQREVTSQIAQLGSDLINILPGGASFRSGRVSGTPSGAFRPELTSYIKQTCPSVSNIVAISQSNVNLYFGEERISATAVGTEPAYQVINLYNPTQGRFIEDHDLQTVSNVLILGSRASQNLFPSQNPLGQRVKLTAGQRTLYFTVIGVMEEKGQGLTGNFDTQVYLPLTTQMQKIANTSFVSSYIAQSRSQAESMEAVAQIEYFLTRYMGDNENFSILSQDQLLNVINQVTNTLNLMLGGIAGISLLVGGIGIMNIMLVSVTERTREIGIRKALGAKNRHILSQFMTEALTLSGLGGIIGISLGYLGAAAIANIGGWPLVVSIISITLALGFALLIGLFFGIYPAMKAAKLDPVKALSYE